MASAKTTSGRPLRVTLPSDDAPPKQQYTMTDPREIEVAMYEVADAINSHGEPVVSRDTLRKLLAAATDYAWLALHEPSTGDAQRKIADLRRAIRGNQKAGG